MYRRQISIVLIYAGVALFLNAFWPKFWTSEIYVVALLTALTHIWLAYYSASRQRSAGPESKYVADESDRIMIDPKNPKHHWIKIGTFWFGVMMLSLVAWFYSCIIGVSQRYVFHIPSGLLYGIIASIINMLVGQRLFKRTRNA